MTLFGLFLGWGLWNGMQVAAEHRATAAEFHQRSNDFLSEVRRALEGQMVDPKAVAGGGSVAVMPEAPFPLLAIGQSDLTPQHESVVLWRLTTLGDFRAELQNPSHLLAGRFDLAFAIVWLYPLALLALLYDLLAWDREAGTLRLALAQGMAPWRWVAARGLIRALPVMGLALLSIVAAGLPGVSLPRFGFALAVVMAYGLFWLGLAMVVNSVSRSAAGAAVFLGACWILFVFVVPTLMNLTVETAYPTPSRPELIAATRAASGEAAARGGELLHSFYRDHPELAPADRQSDFAAIHLAAQDRSSRAIAPALKRFDIQLDRQQELVSWLRLLTPSIAAYEALTDLAGTGFWRHRAFRRQVSDFKAKVAEFYAPRIHRREPLTLNDFEGLPRFVFREEPIGEWRRRVAASIGGILAMTGGLAAWVWRRLGVEPLSASAA